MRALFLRFIIAAVWLAAACSHPDNSPTFLAGWKKAGSVPRDYVLRLERQPGRQRPVVVLSHAARRPDGFGAILRQLSASPFRGNRVRLSVPFATRDVVQSATAWMRIDRKRAMVAIDNMENRRVRGTTRWTTYDIVLDVPRDADEIFYGVSLKGRGTVSVGDPVLSVVSNDVAVTDLAPQILSRARGCSCSTRTR